MLGLLVSEFVNMVEAQHGAQVADAILFGTDLPTSGEEDPLDRYPAAQLQVLFDVLSRRVGQAPHALLQSLAARVIRRIRLVNPDVFVLHADLFGQIAASGEDAVLCAYEVDEAEVEEMELLFGERAAAESLVHGLLSDLNRYARGTRSDRSHRAHLASAHIRYGMR